MHALPLAQSPSHACRRRLVGSLVLVLGLVAAAAPAQAQLFDETFSATTSSQPVHAVAVQADGKVLIGGYFTQVNATPRSYVARLMPDGALDTAFTASANSYVWAIAVQPDGKILVGGQFGVFNGSAAALLVRLNADGSRDTGFTLPSGFCCGHGVRVLRVQPDGKILVGGWFWNGSAYTGLTRLNTDGTIDGAFAPSPNSSVYDLDLQSDGRILLAGDFTTVAGATRNHFARLQPNGALDNTFNPDAQGGDGHAVAVRPDGKVLLGGTFNWVGGDYRNRIALVNADGTRDPAFNPNATGSVVEIIAQSDGKALIGGAFTGIGSANVRTLARLHADGSLDTTFVPFTAIGGYVQQMVVQSDGRILVVGDYGPNTVARFLPGGVANVAPTITPPANQTLLATSGGFTTGQLPFTVGDPDGQAGNVEVTVVGSTNENIVARTSIFLQGTGANRTLRLTTGGGNAAGTTTITLRANDGLNTTDTAFTVTTTNVNSPPVISAIANQSLSGTPTSSLSTGALPFTVTDPEGFAVTVTGVSSNTSLVQNFSVNLGGSGANRTVNAVVAFGAVGQTTITLTASDGVMTSSTSFVVTVARATPVPPELPRSLTVAVSRNNVSFAWLPPVQGTVTGYVLEVGFSAGTTALSLPIGNTLSFGALAPAGTYFVRVRAQTAGGLTGASNEVSFNTNAPPLAPLNLQAQVSGNNLALHWTENPGGAAPLAYQLLVGTATGLSNLAVLPLPPSARSFAVVAPTGIYYLRLRAVNAAGASPDSNEVRVTPGMCERPAAPSGLSASVVPGGVTVNWNSPAGVPPTGYVLLAGSVPGVADVGTFPLPPTLSISSPAPPGRYYVRLLATTGPGCTSDPSGEITFVVP